MKPTRRTALAWLAASVTAVSGLGAGAAAPAAPPPRFRPLGRTEVFPDVAFKDRAGLEIGFVELRGRPVVAVFWATWCGVCHGEMPKLNRLQAALADRAWIVPLSIDRGGMPVVDRYFARRKLNALTPYLDPEQMFAAIMGIRGVPTAFVLDAAGRMAAVAEGPVDWESAQVRRYLLALA